MDQGGHLTIIVGAPKATINRAHRVANANTIPQQHKLSVPYNCIHFIGRGEPRRIRRITRYNSGCVA